MQIELFDVVTNAGRELKKEIPIEMEVFDSGFDTYPIRKKSSLLIGVKNSGGKTLKVEAKAEVLLTAPCDRCLTDVDVNINVDYSREFALNKGVIEMDDLDVAEFIDGLILDTEQLVQDEILVNWPMKVLCKEDCKGICNKCGCNLNEQTCSCDRTVVDPRMAAIQDVFNKFKEV